jgi:RNA polymerase sigma factor (sigma-70 family)
MWKSGSFSGKVGVTESTPAHDPGSQTDFAVCSVMNSPSPLDRCWTVNDWPGVLPMLPAVRAAVEQHWPDMQRAAASVLRDESLATEMMEAAIERAVAYLADHPPEQHEDVSAILARFCREEVGRRRKQQAQLVLVDFSVASEPSSPDTAFSAADAAIDAEKILRDAPAEVREAVMLRYGSSESWREVAARTATSPEAIRKKCKRFLNYIRRELGIPGTPQ